MRKRIVTAIFVCAIIVAGAGAFAGDAAVRVFVDRRETKLDPPAKMRDGTAYVALRGVAKALGASTKWDADAKTATVTVGNKRTRVAASDGITVKGVLFLPLRATGEALGCTVEWDSAQRAIEITTDKPNPTGGG